MHVDLIGPHSKSIRKNQPGGVIIHKNVSLTYMKTIDPDTGWSKIVEILTFDLAEVTDGNDEYIDKSSAKVSQLFNITWIFRNPH